MICISIRETSYNAFLKAVKKADRLCKKYPEMMLELRLDLCEMSPKECRQLFSSTQLPTVVSTIKSTRNLIPAAIDGGAKYVDIDYYAKVSDFCQLDSRIADGQVQKLFTFQDYYTTPTLSQLKSIYKEAIEYGADLLRFVCRSENLQEAKRLMYLYTYQNFKTIRKIPMMAYSTGTYASLTSLTSLILGAPYANISLTKKGRSFEEQLTLSDFESNLDKNFIEPAIRGKVGVPTSKSIAHRAILAAMLAKGESNFGKIQSSRDIDFLLAFIEQMGAKVMYDHDELRIWGIANNANKPKDRLEGLSKISASLANIIPDITTQNFYVGESGLLAHFSMPIMAQLFPKVTVSGEGKLMEKSMYDVKTVFEDFDVSCILSNEDTLPMIIEGQLQGGEYDISARRGDPLISGLLMALPLSKKDTLLHVHGVTKVSAYPILTIDILKSFGIEISCETVEHGLDFHIPGRQKYKPVEMPIEGSWGAAMNFAVAGAVFGSVTMTHLNQRSVQSDREIMDVLADAGAIISYGLDGSITVSRGALSGFNYNLTNKPFLFPILAVLAAFSEGESVLKGYHNLIELNESRTQSVITEFSKMGVLMAVDDDLIRIQGMSYIRRLMENNLLKGGHYIAAGDHRVAMALKIASFGCKGNFSIDDMDCVNKSFPHFNDILKQLSVKNK